MGPKPLKEFTSIHEVTVQDVMEILDAWEQGVLDDEAVFCFAEDLLYLAGTWPSYPRDDSRSTLFATLETLELMYINPTLPADIPALRAFLGEGQTAPATAWHRLDRYWDSVDWDKRLRETTKQRFGQELE